MATCAIALGGNIGDSAARFHAALAKLKAAGHSVSEVSSFIATRPMGESAGDQFLNAAALVETHASPAQFLQQLHSIEEQLGRIRNVHWGPRTLDLDLLFYNQTVLDTDALVLPHPRLWYRRFVLQPLHEIAADWVHPVLNQSTEELFRRLRNLPLSIEVVLPESTVYSLTHLEKPLRLEFPAGCFKLSKAAPTAKTKPDTFARIVCTKSEDGEQRVQPEHKHHRRIDVVADSEADALTGIRDVLSAAIG